MLLIGRLVYEKGFQVALDALPRVIERVGDVRFLVAGSGTHEQELKAQAERLGLHRHGTFLGWIGDDVLHSLYRIADLTRGAVALRAVRPRRAGGDGQRLPVHRRRHRRAARGRPQRRRRPALPRRATRAALADQMARVLTDPALRDRLVTEAAEHVARFDWVEVAARTAALYTELTGDRQLVG